MANATVNTTDSSNGTSFSMRPRIKVLFDARVNEGSKASELINQALCVYFGVDPSEYMVIERKAKYESEEAKVTAHTLKALNANPEALAMVRAALEAMNPSQDSEGGDES